MSIKITHIIYTDDDADDHYIFSEIMSEIYPHIKLTHLYTCNELIKWITDEATDTPDLVYLDLNMPGNTNLECLTSLKLIARSANIPVVIYTTAGDARTVEKAISRGAFKYIQKPAILSGIAQEIRKTISELEK